MLVLSWNLFHGRSLPPARRSLYGEFADTLGRWRWDLALLQEAPPWWPERLARELGMAQRRALTSRNSLLPVRRALAEHRPELVKANGGGCNALLSRIPIAEHTKLRLRRWPERRVAQLARLQDGTCVVNFHASTRPARAEQELSRLWRKALAWAGADPLILGGDLNLRSPSAPQRAQAEGGPIEHVAGSGVDHLFARGLAGADVDELAPGGEGASNHVHILAREVPLDGKHVELSDHAPLLVRLQR